MARPAYGGYTTCESCISIDVRRWHREGLLAAGRRFTRSWRRGAGSSSSIEVRTDCDAVVLSYRLRKIGEVEWKPVEQRVLIAWTNCHFGGRRPWFICTMCGRRAALLYCAGELFACRSCSGLVYESQQESPLYRSLSQAQKIRMRLGGSPDIFEAFPDRPKGMHERTYSRIYRQAQAQEAKCTTSIDKWIRRPR
jgi:hypothetical protein